MDTSTYNAKAATVNPDFIFKFKEQPPMRGLYRVHVVNIKTEAVVSVGPFVARSADDARLHAARMGYFTEDPSADLDFIPEHIGIVRD